MCLVCWVTPLLSWRSLRSSLWTILKKALSDQMSFRNISKCFHDSFMSFSPFLVIFLPVLMSQDVSPVCPVNAKLWFLTAGLSDLPSALQTVASHTGISTLTYLQVSTSLCCHSVLPCAQKDTSCRPRRPTTRQQSSKQDAAAVAERMIVFFPGVNCFSKVTNCSLVCMYTFEMYCKKKKSYIFNKNINLKLHLLYFSLQK